MKTKRKQQILSLLILLLIVCINSKGIAQTAVLPNFISTNCITGNSISLTISGGSNAANETTAYALTNGSGNILQISNQPIFNNLNIGSYIVYAVSYETAEGVNQMVVGSNILSVNSNGCIDFSAPYSFNVCPTHTDCDYYINNDITMITTGGNTSNGNLVYVLSDSNGTIVDIANTPTFSNIQNIGTYFAYALAYENGTGISNLALGNSINSITFSGLCYDWSPPFIFEVCFNENPSVTITKTGVDTIRAGNFIFYTFTIDNNAGTILNNVAFTDILVNGFFFTSEARNMTNGLQVVGSAIHTSTAQLTLNNIPIGTSSFQLLIQVPYNTTLASFCNEAQLNGLVANNPNLEDNATSNQFCTTIWKPEDDCNLPTINNILTQNN